MTNNISNHILDILHAVWRRRYLICIPILAAVPLAVIIAKLGPKVYIAKALMLLQEAGGNNPLNTRPSAYGQIAMKERVAGLRALMNSDRVLASAVRDIYGINAQDDPAGADIAKYNLSQALSLELIGTDFLEFRLKGSSPHGLGTELQIITTRFLESLLLPEQSAISASELLVEKRRKDLEEAQRAYSEFRQGEGRNWLGEFETHKSQLTRLEQQLESARTTHEAHRTLLDAIKEKQSPENADANNIKNNITRVKAELKKLAVLGPESKAQLTSTKQQLDLLSQLETAMVDFNKSRQLVEQTETAILDLRQKLAKLQKVNIHGIQLERRVRETQQTLDSFLRRYTAKAPDKGINVLEAPQSIKMIDHPQDPTQPENSGLKYFIFTILAAIGLGTGLALFAELIDPRLHRESDIETLTNLPVIARLPNPA